MKRTRTCPKCQSHNIVKIPGKKSGHYHNKMNINFLSQVLITRYLCTSCGYSEEWVDKEKDLDKIDKAYRKDSDFNEFV